MTENTLRGRSEKSATGESGKASEDLERLYRDSIKKANTARPSQIFFDTYFYDYIHKSNYRELGSALSSWADPLFRRKPRGLLLQSFEVRRTFSNYIASYRQISEALTECLKDQSQKAKPAVIFDRWSRRGPVEVVKKLVNIYVQIRTHQKKTKWEKKNLHTLGGQKKVLLDFEEPIWKSLRERTQGEGIVYFKEHTAGKTLLIELLSDYYQSTNLLFEDIREFLRTDERLRAELNEFLAACEVVSGYEQEFQNSASHCMASMKTGFFLTSFEEALPGQASIMRAKPYPWEIILVGCPPPICRAGGHVPLHRREFSGCREPLGRSSRPPGS